MVLFDRPYTNFYWSAISTITESCTSLNKFIWLEVNYQVKFIKHNLVLSSRHCVFPLCQEPTEYQLLLMKASDRGRNVKF